MIPENIYGHRKRLDWIVSHCAPDDRILEVGCGTGYMITIPLVESGFDATGIDRDPASIEYGRAILQEGGLSPERLSTLEIDAFEDPLDVVVVSEVLEHMEEADALSLLEGVYRCMRPGGTLLVTVPNGFGVFEVESFLWYRCGVGRLLRATRADSFIGWLKSPLATAPVEYEHPSSLDASPHVRRFTPRRVRLLVELAGFAVEDISGSVLIAGPFSNLAFTGVTPIMKLNAALGGVATGAAVAFFLTAYKPAGRHEEPVAHVD